MTGQQPGADGPLSGVEVRTPCPYCPPPAMIPRTLLAEHITNAHPGRPPLGEPTLAEAADVLYALGKACLVVKGTLDVPYQDDPRWSPWTRWVAKPARTAYNLGVLLRRRHSRTPGSRAHLTPTAATRLYDAARGLADATVGHTETCEWHTNGHAYCSCPAYGAACAGVDAVLEALAAADTTGGTT